MKRKLSKILVATLCALAIILHIYVHLTQLDFASIMESRRLKIQSYCVDHGFSARKDSKVKNIMKINDLAWCPVPGANDDFYLKMLQFKGLTMEEIANLQLLYGPENLKDLSESQIAPQNWQHHQLNAADHATAENTKWLVIVAHPWIRLVSIYKSCYEKFNYNCFLKHGKLMQPQNTSTSSQITFQDFISYVLQNPVRIQN